jgi:tetratricopeptide (TPR) repeat protein
MLTCTNKNDEESYNLAINSDKLIREGKYNDAFKDVENAIKLDKKNYFAYHNLGVVKIKLDYPKSEIIEAFKKSIELNPNFGMGFFSLANYYFEIKDYPNSIIYCDKYINGFMKNIDDEFLKSIIYSVRGESRRHTYYLKGALEDLNLSLKYDSTRAEVYKERAEVYFSLNNVEKAILDCNKAIYLNSDYSQAYNLRGNCFFQKYEYSKALSDYSKSIEIEPNDSNVLNNRSRLYYFLGKPNEAMYDLLKIDSIRILNKSN